jgi:hypothetical protein
MKDSLQKHYWYIFLVGSESSVVQLFTTVKKVCMFDTKTFARNIYLRERSGAIFTTLYFLGNLGMGPIS